MRTSAVQAAGPASTTSRWATSAEKRSRCSVARATASRVTSSTPRSEQARRPKRCVAVHRAMEEMVMPARKALREELEPIEYASRDEIASLQLERLRWSLSHAYAHVPHYRRKFDEAGVHPGDVRCLDD